MSRKKLLLLEGDSTTSLFKLLRLRVGVLVRVTQFVVVKSEFSCNTKVVEGTSQKRSRLLLVAERFSSTLGGVRQT